MKIYRLIRKTHKWISVGFGVFFVIWLITGIVYVFPQSILIKIDRWFVGGRQVKAIETKSNLANNKFVPTQITFKDIQISIPEAISILETELDSTIKVVSCSVYKTSERFLYEIALEDGKSYLVDAIEGKPTKITQLEIINNALAEAPSGSNIVEMALLKERPYAYAEGGPIPVYRFIFDDVARTHVYISPDTAKVALKNVGWFRFIEWMLCLHRFDFVTLLLKRDIFRRGVLIIISLIGLAVVMTGCYLALPAKIRRPKRLFERKI